jgi:hypothetical protein
MALLWALSGALATYAQADPAPAEGTCSTRPADAGATGDTGSTGWDGHADVVGVEQELDDTCAAMVAAANSVHGDLYVIAGAIVAVFVFSWVLYYVMPS